MDLQKIYTRDDLMALEAIIQQIWPEVFVPIIGQKQVDYMLANYQSLDVIEADMAEGTQYYLVKDEGNVVGYFAFKALEDVFFLSKLYLSEAARGQGHFRQVWAFLVNQAHLANKDRFFLHVHRGNARAISVYEHLGFTIDKAVDTPLGDFVLTDYWMSAPVPK
jgi:ribosomal protein S18 acetylase RimI-like enzyme